MLDILPSILLFQDLAPGQIDLLKTLFEEYTCPLETVIFKQGDPANYLYILIRGKVAIHYKPYDGSSIILTRLRNGDVFGWSAVVGSASYTSSIISESSIECVRIKRNDLRILIQDHPETGKILIDRLANIVSSRWKNARSQVQSILNSDQLEK
ncbi:MAG TPA: cyclic nucleotide-binding domain-containing protein [Anaerolineales bacterium]|nr:cyclic nucleotide-binding domain-containing protein [Anaerolineales bacterium]